MKPAPNEPTGVLLMAYGTPETLDDVAAYFTHIRRGRAPSPEAVADLQRRYAAVGGGTPLLAITRDVARLLELELGEAYRLYVGMKHWHPYIAETIRRIAADGIRRVIAIVLAPHYSRLSIGGYDDAVRDANRRLDEPLSIGFVDSWHLLPAFIDMMAARVRAGIDTFAPEVRGDVAVGFSAHSLPERIREWNDPYESQLLESCAAVAACAGLSGWRFAWQSAGGTSEPWLGPDLLDVLGVLRAEGRRHVLSVPIGFVSDHLEILYDIDHEAQARAAELGLTLRRTEMPNASPELVATLASLVDAVERGALAVSGAGR